MTRRSFFTKLVACAVAPFAVKAVPWRNRSIPEWLNYKNWNRDQRNEFVYHVESRSVTTIEVRDGEDWIIDPFTNKWRKWRHGEYLIRDAAFEPFEK